jgi:hypothetical protein
VIISEKWKYLFVGLPFSASSGISKELVEYYDGEPISWKHSNVTDLVENGFDITEYRVFAVYRNPVDIAFSHYNKMLTNAYEVFTKPEYFRENGGWVSKRARKVFNRVAHNNLDFNGYLKIQYDFPYDSVFSLNKPYLDYVIDFDNVVESFDHVLREIGIEPVRSLPVFNKTKKTAVMTVVDQAIITKVFGAFFLFNNLEMGGNQAVGLKQKLLYKSIRPLRVYRWKKLDRTMRVRKINDYSYINS